jgi:hypothetical protein
MTREEAVGYWKEIVTIVYSAENLIVFEWLPRLKEAQQASVEERLKVHEEYRTAIAKEIVERLTDEEVERLEE